MLGIFVRTLAAGALGVLTAAVTLPWSTADDVKASGTVVAWGLVAALIAALIAVGWALVAKPATTPLGRAIRQAVQTLLGLPIASVVVTSLDDVATAGELVVPTVVAVAIAFLTSLLSGLNPPPPVTDVPALQDTIGTK